ncbi:hypothetical protein [Paralcaligenes ginsengisoli]
MFTFEHYEVGQIYGPHHLFIGPDLESQWLQVFPQDIWQGNTVPPGMLSVITMLAYTAVITPRPPGNIHGGQRFDVLRLPRRGETLATTIQCEDKQIRKGRRWVYLAFETTGDTNEMVFRGRFASIVAQ